MSEGAPAGRIVSMDQFRGYTVLGMFLVNFLGHFDKVHPVLQHNDNYFSYADTIMPSFIFAVGFSYRLTILRRLPSIGSLKTYWGYVRRSFALILVSLMIYGFGSDFGRWNEFSEMPKTLADKMTEEDNVELEKLKQAKAEKREEYQQAVAEDPSLKRPGIGGIWQNFKEGFTEADIKNSGWRKTFYGNWRYYIATLLKADLWEVLAIIGVCQLFIMPVIAAPWVVRLIALLACAVGYTFMAHWFNWEFIAGYSENWMVKIWKTGGRSSWDGGFFGIVSWSIPMIAGSLVYDVIAKRGTASAGKRFFVWGCALMILAYGMSCMSRLYDVEYGAKASEVKGRNAESPVIPDFSLASAKNEEGEARGWTSLLAEPPFVQPDPERKWLENFWMMGKRQVTLSYITVSTGFALILYAMFILVCDGWGWKLGVFTTFGMNPLAAYIIHYMWYNDDYGVGSLVPRDSQLWFVIIGLIVFYLFTYLCVRALEKRNIYIRL